METNGKNATERDALPRRAECGECGDELTGTWGNWRHLDGTPICRSREDAKKRKPPGYFA